MKQNIETTNYGKTDKVTRYGWTLKDSPGVFTEIPKLMLNIADEYQRDVTQSKVKEIAAEWSWFGCGALVVADRAGEYWVVDGQHRLLAALRRSDIQKLPCMVFETVGVVSEAKAFLDVNTNRKPVSAISKLKALAISNDPIASFVVQELDRLGLKIAKTAARSMDIKCISTCQTLAKNNKDSFVSALEMSAKLSQLSGEPLSEKVLSSLYYFDKNIDKGLKDQRLCKRIIDIGQTEIIKEGTKASAYFAAGGMKVWATGALTAINKGLRIKFAFISE